MSEPTVPCPDCGAEMQMPKDSETSAPQCVDEACVARRKALLDALGEPIWQSDPIPDYPVQRDDDNRETLGPDRGLAGIPYEP